MEGLTGYLVLGWIFIWEINSTSLNKSFLMLKVSPKCPKNSTWFGKLKDLTRIWLIIMLINYIIIIATFHKICYWHDPIHHLILSWNHIHHFHFTDQESESQRCYKVKVPKLVRGEHGLQTHLGIVPNLWVFSELSLFPEPFIQNA